MSSRIKALARTVPAGSLKPTVTSCGESSGLLQPSPNGSTRTKSEMYPEYPCGTGYVAPMLSVPSPGAVLITFSARTLLCTRDTTDCGACGADL